MLVDTNVLIRHLTGDPPAQAAGAQRLIAEAEELVIPDVIIAECFYVLRSFYRRSAAEAAGALGEVIRARQVRVLSEPLLERALELCAAGASFADAYLVALAELADVGPIASFDRDLDRFEGVKRVEPA